MSQLTGLHTNRGSVARKPQFQLDEFWSRSFRDVNIAERIEVMLSLDRCHGTKTGSRPGGQFRTKVCCSGTGYNASINSVPRGGTPVAAWGYPACTESFLLTSRTSHANDATMAT